jgi:hypothetical protein
MIASRDPRAQPSYYTYADASILQTADRAPSLQSPTHLVIERNVGEGRTGEDEGSPNNCKIFCYAFLDQFEVQWPLEPRQTVDQQ